MKYTKDESIDKSDYEDFCYYLANAGEVLMEMANISGNDIRVENRLPFAFFFCSKDKVHGAHAIRVKILWNPSKMTSSADGYMELRGEYRYVCGSRKYEPKGWELDIARSFFKKYKVLFASVWEGKLDTADVEDYLKTRIRWNELLSTFSAVSEINCCRINHCKSLIELEDCIRKHHTLSLWD